MSKNPSSEPKVDRRVARTRRLLRDALFALVLEKGFDTVTIEEITQRADVGRTTFYLHYRDKESLLVESIGELVEDLVTQMAEQSYLGEGLETATALEQAAPAIGLTFRHVAQNAQLYHVIFRGEGTSVVAQRLRVIIAQATGEVIRVLQEREQIKTLNLQVPMDVIQNYIAGAWTGMASWWLDNGLPYSPEQMALMFQKMVLRGAREVLGLKPR